MARNNTKCNKPKRRRYLLFGAWNESQYNFFQIGMMLAFKVNLFEQFLHSFADIVLGENGEKQYPVISLFSSLPEELVGSIEIEDLNDKGANLLRNKTVSVPSLQGVRSKRKIPSTQSWPKKPKPLSDPALPDRLADSLVVSRANPESLINITQDLTTGEKCYRCSFCDYSAGRKDNAKRHIELKHLPKNTVFKCQMCAYTATLKYQLKSHYVSKHSLPDQAVKAMLA